jgi:1-acyl-sn-glycerol-3-phosphate acyltransferase
MSIFAKAQNSFVVPLIKKMFRIKIINPENEPEFGQYIVCANHSSNWDPIIIGACMHKPLRYMAKSELFKVPLLKNLVKWFGAYPVNRSGADVSSIKTTINILEQGEVVGMYPQGSRAKGVHPKNITPKHGFAMIAAKAKTGILPVTIISRKYKVRLFRRTIIVFGKYAPYDELVQDGGNIDDGVSKIGESMSLYKKMTEKIYGEILANYEKYDDINKNI